MIKDKCKCDLNWHIWLGTKAITSTENHQGSVAPATPEALQSYLGKYLI